MNVAVSAAPRTAWVPRIGWTVMLLASIFAAANALLFMLADGHGSPNIRARFLEAPLMAWLHAMGGAVAAVIGPFQFLRSTRDRYRRVHVWLGRTYLIAVLLGGVAGLYFAPGSVGGGVTAAGFTLLALGWLYTGAMAYATIRRRDVNAHRRWMIRNFSLTFAAATLRIELMTLQFSGVPFVIAFAIVSWSSWLPNLLIVEAWMRTRGRSARALQRGVAV